MGDLDELLGFWRSADGLFERVRETRWGAVVADPRFPRIHEANYARVEAADPVELDEVEEVLIGEARRAGATFDHVVVFRPDEQTSLIAEASTRGEHLSFDLVMRRAGRPTEPDPRAAVVDRLDDAFWEAFRASAQTFGIDDEAVIEELVALERRVMLPAGRTWFAVREARRIVTLGALLVLEGVGFVDGVATLPCARRRGHASALVATILAEAPERGARAAYLLTEPDGTAERIYRRAGFRTVGRLASWVARPHKMSDR